jgi:hypothetical protein
MTHYVCYCKNCGDKYLYQGSGQYTLKTPKEYNSREYCPTCKEATVKALSTIPQKSYIDWVEVKEDMLDELLKVEENERKRVEENRNPFDLFPPLRRVFPSLFDTKTNESSKSGEVKVGDKMYRYFYFPSKPKEAKIHVMARLNTLTKEIIDYR